MPTPVVPELSGRVSRQQSCALTCTSIRPTLLRQDERDMAIRLAAALVMARVISWELDLGAAAMNLRGLMRDAQAILGSCGRFVARDPTHRVKTRWLRFSFARLRTKPSAIFHICETIDLFDAESLKYRLAFGAWNLRNVSLTDFAHGTDQKYGALSRVEKAPKRGDTKSPRYCWSSQPVKKGDRLIRGLKWTTGG